MSLPSEKNTTLPSIKAEKRSSRALVLDQASPKQSKSLKTIKIPDGSRKIIEQEPSKKSNKMLPYMKSSDFKDLRDNGFVVDKTLFIQEFIESPFHVIAASFPKRFGKSTNLNMVKTFLQLEVDKDGHELEDKEKSNP